MAEYGKTQYPLKPKQPNVLASLEAIYIYVYIVLIILKLIFGGFGFINFYMLFLFLFPLITMVDSVSDPYRVRAIYAPRHSLSGKEARIVFCDRRKQPLVYWFRVIMCWLLGLCLLYAFFRY